MLAALVQLCPEIHHEAMLRPMADLAGLPPGPASLALKGLERRRMAWRHDDEGVEPAWTPTQAGRGHAETARLKL